MVERSAVNADVPGSNPGRGAIVGIVNEDVVVSDSVGHQPEAGNLGSQSKLIFF